MKLSYFIYTKIPGSGKGWRLAVLGLGRRDADDYIRRHHKGARFSYSVENGGTVDANCGAVTYKAQSVLKNRTVNTLTSTQRTD